MHFYPLTDARQVDILHNAARRQGLREAVMHFLFAIIFLAALPSIPRSLRAQEAVRFPSLQTEQLTPEQKKWAESIAAPPRNGRISNPPYRAYIRSPQLAPLLTALSDYVRWNTSLPARLSELAILITARHWTAQYEWYAHYTLAIKGGLDPAIAEDIAAGKHPNRMKDDETAVYNLATELYRDKQVSDSTFKAALDQLGERGIMDTIGIIGYYDLVSMTLIAMQARPPDDKVRPLPPQPQ
jgi:4-carboxymuconolactone decarboxylase